MHRKYAIRALALLAALCGGVASAALPNSFQKLGNDRLLLMNNDNNSACKVEQQGYVDSFRGGGYIYENGETYWTHDGDPAPAGTSQQPLDDLNLLNGTHHILWRHNVGVNGLVSSNKLWELIACRAGSAAIKVNSKGKDAHGNLRNYIPWQTTSIDVNGSTTIKATDYTKAGMISMQNTTDARIESPFYADGIGTIYFDAINGWVNGGTLTLEIATNTTDGTAFTRDSTNVNWQLQSFSVLVVDNRKCVKMEAEDTTSLNLAWSDSYYAGGWLFYRVRAHLDCREPIRFRICRTTSRSGYDPDSYNYLIVDNVLVSPPPVEVDILQYGKGYDGSREKSRILGWEGAFTHPFLFVDKTTSTPWCYYAGSKNDYIDTSSAEWPASSWSLSNVQFHYRWTYLGIDSTAWKTIPMEQVSGRIQFLAKDGAAIDLSEGLGDIEYYYTAQIDKAPHYDPVDFACGSSVTNTITIDGTSYKMPYGSDWYEGGAPWTITRRRSPKEGALPSGGTDWFTRAREGNTVYEDLAVVVTNLLDGTVSNVWMELVGDHAWRAYYYVPTNMAGQAVRFHFAAYNEQKEKNESFLYNTNYWFLSTDKIGYLPYSGAAVKYSQLPADSSGTEIWLDTCSTHVLFEFNDESGAFAVSHAAYQDFNLWTDAGKGYMGYYSTTAAVSEAKQTFPETFDTWSTSSASSSLWNEDFYVSGLITPDSPYFPGVEFGTGQRTPHGWTADNGMYICQSYTNAEEGLSLEMEGCGRGMVSLQNLSASDVPSGVGQVDFTARIAQPFDFNGFAWSINGLKATNYAITAKAMISTRREADMAKSDPAVSLVGYYRPMTGCYEARARRVETQKLELSIWKWEQRGASLVSRCLGLRTMGANGANVATLNMMVSMTVDYNYSSWHSMGLSMCNTATGTVVQARLARDPNSTHYQSDSSQLNAGLTIAVCDPPASNNFTCGTWGMGTVNCAGYVGDLQLAGPMNFRNPTTIPVAATNMTLLQVEVEGGDWIIPAGRYRNMVNRNEFTRNETQYFRYGFKGLVPEQEVVVKTALAGSADGNEWVEAGRVKVTNFLAEAYSLSPMVVDDSYVRLATAGQSLDTRVDVAVDDIAINGWRGRDYPNLNSNYGQKDNWIYTGCWIESAVGVEGSYTVVEVPKTNEFCYIFTNAGKTVTFTPREDMWLSQALVVGGGGAGGWASGGGGGGGGVYALTNGMVLEAGVPVSITVGRGGNNYFSVLDASTMAQRGDCGEASYLVIGDDEYVAYGGGGGGSYNGNLYSGYGNNNYSGRLATGGGNGGDTTGVRTSSTGKPDASNGWGGYGRGGGGNGGDSRFYVSGGGGGAGGPGVGGTTNNLEELDATHILMDVVAGAGGIGWLSDITGTPTYYGGGGGAGEGRAFTSTLTFNSHIYHYLSANSKYWMVRNSTGSGAEGNRWPGEGGLGGGGRGLSARSSSPAKGENGENGLGGGGGGGSMWNGAPYRPGGRGGDGAVILRISGLAKHQCVIQPARGRGDSPIGVRSPWLANGLSMLNFSYTAANSNAVLLLQVATNLTGTGQIYNQTRQMYSGWTTITNFTFSETDTKGVKACYMSLRSPVKGLMRLIADPEVVDRARYQDDPDYGRVTLTKLICYDEPALDARSWTGWNMWTTGWDGEKPNEFAFLYDGLYGRSCSLNWSATKSDNLTGITGFSNDLAEPDKAEGDNEYSKSYPYVQGPAMTNGIGYVKFRARKMTTDQEAPSVVTLFGLTRPDDASSAEELTNIVVSAGRWTQYTWKSTVDKSGYLAVRLAVKGAEGSGGRNFPTPTTYMDGTPIGKLQRVMIDEVAFSEPIAPRLALLNARPFRTPLTENVVISNILDEAQQPLTHESFGFQVQLQPQQLADDIDLKSVRVFLAYYAGVDKWGWKNWTNDPNAVWSELTRVSNTNMIWRSTFENSASIAAAQHTPGTVVQYFLQAKYKDNAGKWHSHEIDSVDWDGGPSWYWPIDYNEEYGGNSPEAFSPYTIIDSVSPKRAWFNEVNYYDGYDSMGWIAATNQYIEIAVPSGADMTGWYLRVQNRNKRKCTLCVIGYGDIEPSTTANMTNHYSFLTIASPKTYAARTLGNAASGKWSRNSELATWAEITDGEMTGSSPYALELVRPSHVVEHQIVVEGTNYWIGLPLENYGSGTNLAAELVKSDKRGNTWFFAGTEAAEGTLSVFRSHGEDASCWTNRAKATPAKINSTVGQTIDPDWFLPPSDEFVWIYATILGGNMYVMDDTNKLSEAVFMVGKNTSTNITFVTDPWYQIVSLTEDGKRVAEAEKRSSYSLNIQNVTNTVDIFAKADIVDDITTRISPTDPYYNAVIYWLKNKYADVAGEIKPARYIGISNTVTNEMSLKQMYWLDIPPTEGDWVFRAGMVGAPPDSGVNANQPAVPVVHTNALDGSVMTNDRVCVFLQLTNEHSNVCYPPRYLQGLEPGSTSENYTGTPNWTSVTFKVTGALQNDIANDKWIPLRWFVFGPESFGQPGDPDEYTAVIEITDPHSRASPAYVEGWADYPNAKVFYRWNLDESRRPQTIEMLKKDSTY